MLENIKDDFKIISFEEYDDSLNSVDYVDLIILMVERINMPKEEIDKVIENHFNFKFSIKKNYKSFVNSIQNYMIRNKKSNYVQQSLF